MNVLEADLNDIDEFIQAERGFQTRGAEASLVGTRVKVLFTIQRDTQYISFVQG